MTDLFRVAASKDFLKADGTLGFGDIGLEMLESAGNIQWQFLEEDVAELQGHHLRDFDGLLLLAPRVGHEAIEQAERLKIIARFGVGFDNVDVDACTENGVLLTITPDGVRRPVATSVLCFLLALSHKLLTKDRITRAGRWHDKLDHMGRGLTGRSLGVIGLGNIGREVFRLAQPLQMRHLGFDPYVNEAALAGLDVTVMRLEQLMQEADFIVICCALSPETHHLIDAGMIGLMQASTYLINVARGPVVDQQALTAALQSNAIAGAALDVFEQEPVDPGDPLLSLDNVILAPHALCWTDEMFLGNGRAACQSLIDVACGEQPQVVVNRDVLDQPQLRAKLSKG